MNEQVISFTARAKEEIFYARPLKASKWLSFACGLFLLGARVSEDGIMFLTENKHVSMCFSDAFKMLTGKRLQYSRSLGGKGNTLYRLHSGDAYLIAKLYNTLEIDRDNPENDAHMSTDEARLAFISGAFMACASVTDPNNDYHLSFRPATEAAGDRLFAMLCKMGYPPKAALYRGEQMLYYKESEAIEDILTAVGAPICSLELMNVKVYRDLRNKTNRITNAETANIGRTAAAAAAQIVAIRHIFDQGQDKMLPPELYEMASLRLDNPEASLSELGRLFLEPVSRSGVNHRMRRLLEWSDSLRDNQK